MNKLEQLQTGLATTSIEGLAELVKEMRYKQVRYFETRDKWILLESKSLERQVDTAVKKILGNGT